MMALVKSAVFRAFWINASVCHPDFLSFFFFLQNTAHSQINTLVDALFLPSSKPIKSSLEFRVTSSYAFRVLLVEKGPCLREPVLNSPPDLLTRPLAKDRP